ncbi:putative reverse transcriptase domain-containing protein [Tanacetum coccineum]
MPWNTLMKMMPAKYCPRNEIKKLEMEIWELKVKGTDLASYTQRFQELALMSPTNGNTANIQRGTGAGQKATCCEYEAHGHFKRECPKLRNNNRGNQGGNGNDPAKVYVVGNAGTNPDSNVVTGMFLLNNRYASILFDTGADKSEVFFGLLDFRAQQGYTPNYLRSHYLMLLNLPADDLIRNKKEHKEHLKAILELLKKEESYAKFFKCEFWIPKIESIKDKESPKTPTEIHQFLGLVGYYRRFIEGISKITKSMTKLIQKGVKFDWGEKEESAFQLIKQKLCSAPIVALPEKNYIAIKELSLIVVYCDASHKGLGAVLMQREKVISYALR